MHGPRSDRLRWTRCLCPHHNQSWAPARRAIEMLRAHRKSYLSRWPSSILSSGLSVYPVSDLNFWLVIYVWCAWEEDSDRLTFSIMYYNYISFVEALEGAMRYLSHYTGVYSLQLEEHAQVHEGNRRGVKVLNHGVHCKEYQQLRIMEPLEFGHFNGWWLRCSAVITLSL